MTGRKIDPTMILGAVRTPLGSFQGVFSTLSATDLGSVAIDAAVARSGVEPTQIDEVLMGNVLSAGLGQAPSRQAALGAGLAKSTACTTISKVCGSGMKAVMHGCDTIGMGNADVIVAGGMESMTNAPYLLPKARSGMRIGHDRILDHMMLDGLEDAYEVAQDGTRCSMGTFGEDCAKHYQFSRDAQDAYAIESLSRARQAAQGAFNWEITPVDISTRHGKKTIDIDEGPQKIDRERIPSLRPAFQENGTITAASSSSINDGAAAIVLAGSDVADKIGAQPIAQIVGYAAYAGEPNWFTTAPIHATQKLAKKIGWSMDDVDLFEINEAFAVVAMAAMQDLGVGHDRLNVHGGAVALGHPIGASGARILVSLIGALRCNGAKRGIASICIGGGEATAVAVEMVS